MMIVDRYVTHGLRCNPFAVPHHDADVSRQFVDRGLAPPPPPGSGVLVQVVGQKGAGKSTQIFEWQRCAAGPYHYVPVAPYRSRWARPPIEQLVYADEVDRMPVPLRRWWFRQLAQRSATAIVGTHRDLEPLARRCGLAVTTHCLGPADLSLVRDVLAAKVASCASGEGPLFEMTTAEVADVHRHCGGSLRTAEVLAHELVAQRVRSTDAPNSTLSTKASP